MRVVIATDAWAPQVNGVVTTLTQTRNSLLDSGHDVLMITPTGRRSYPCPSYPEIRLAFFAGKAIAREIAAFRPDCIHIATEGPIGLSVRRYCLKNKIPFTTAYHTQFPEYVRSRFPIPISWTIALTRWFHKPAVRTMVPTKSVQELLTERGFEHVVLWSRGVDTSLFCPTDAVNYAYPRPIWLYLGRVSVEKNIEEFLSLDIPGTKVVIGDGPDREKLSVRYPACQFLGYKFGADLARHLAGADVFVFPSKTDTFGLVMLEAMSCGLPVAAFPVTGPIDVVCNGKTGILADDLRDACQQALNLGRDTCREYAKSRSWDEAARQFCSHLAVFTAPLQPQNTQGPIMRPAPVSNKLPRS